MLQVKLGDTAISYRIKSEADIDRCLRENDEYLLFQEVAKP
ncbi:hypothetical protein [Clostridium formicaceticum]|nr:hypothetical protein [Clostridium formicaceticum]